MPQINSLALVRAMQLDEEPTICAIADARKSSTVAALSLLIGATLAIGAIAGLAVFFWDGSRTQLDLYNTGNKPLRVRRGDDRKDARVIEPGGRYHARFAAGDALHVFVGKSESSPETLVILEEHDPVQDDPPRVTAEAFVDESGSVVFRYLDAINASRRRREATLRDASLTTPATTSHTGSARFDASFEGEGRENGKSQ